MLPVGLLMIEHRLIEKLIGLWQDALPALSKCQSIEASFWDPTIDFMDEYADKCHHGKEENIMFSRLKQKNLSPELEKIMGELINEHQVARDALSAVIKARGRCASNDAQGIQDFYGSIKTICDLYPAHIEKEDKRFFLPCMEYFSEQEKQKMLEDFEIFDRGLFHEKYKKLIAGIETGAGQDGLK